MTSLCRASCIPLIETGPVQESIDNIFTPIESSCRVPDVIPQFPNHPINPRGILDKVKSPLHTNKFYTAWLFDPQTHPVYSYPYVLFAEQGFPPASPWGLGITHHTTEDISFARGPPPIRVRTVS